MNDGQGVESHRGEWVLWIVAVSCALHATEELLTGWQHWAVAALGIAMPTATFVVMNTVLTAAALFAAQLGWRRPLLALVIASATLVNAVCFHVIPTITRREAAPGIYTAVVLYLPFSTWALVAAARAGVPRKTIVSAIGAGCVLAVGVVVVARLLLGPTG